MAKILFVDDDEAVRYALGKYLRRAGHDVCDAEDGERALALVAQERFDIVITDVIMPNVEGMELITRLSREQPSLPIIAISGGGRVGRAEYLSLTKFLGANATLEKPVDEEALLELIQQLAATDTGATRT